MGNPSVRPRPAPLVTVPRDRVGPAEKPGRRDDVAALQGGPDLVDETGDAVDASAVARRAPGTRAGPPAPRRSPHRRGPLARSGDCSPTTTSLRAQAPEEDVLDERLRLDGGQLRGEAQHDDAVDAGLGDQRQSLVERRDGCGARARAGAARWDVGRTCRRRLAVRPPARASPPCRGSRGGRGGRHRRCRGRPRWDAASGGKDSRPRTICMKDPHRPGLARRRTTSPTPSIRPAASCTRDERPRPSAAGATSTDCPCSKRCGGRASSSADDGQPRQRRGGRLHARPERRGGSGREHLPGRAPSRAKGPTRVRTSRSTAAPHPSAAPRSAGERAHVRALATHDPRAGRRPR